MRTPFCCYCYELEEPVALENRSSASASMSRKGGVCAQRVVARDISSNGFWCSVALSRPGCSLAGAFGLHVKYLALKHKNNKPTNSPVASEMMRQLW